MAERRDRNKWERTRLEYAKSVGAKQTVGTVVLRHVSSLRLSGFRLTCKLMRRTPENARFLHTWSTARGGGGGGPYALEKYNV